MQILPVDAHSLSHAAHIYSEAWKQSHREICSAEFVALHDTTRQMRYLQDEMDAGKLLYLLYDPEPVGIVSVYHDCIENLYVLPEQQRRGYGRKLLEFAVSLCSHPCLWVLSSNTSAIAFYEAFGFSFTGSKKQLSLTLFVLEMSL